MAAQASVVIRLDRANKRPLHQGYVSVPALIRNQESWRVDSVRSPSTLTRFDWYEEVDLCLARAAGMQRPRRTVYEVVLELNSGPENAL